MVRYWPLLKFALAIILAFGSATAEKVKSPPPLAVKKPPPLENRFPNPPSPPSGQLPLSDTCNLVLNYNVSTGYYDPSPYRQSFRLTIRTSWSAIATGPGNVSRLSQFTNDTRDALAFVFQVP